MHLFIRVAWLWCLFTVIETQLRQYANSYWVMERNGKWDSPYFLPWTTGQCVHLPRGTKTHSLWCRAHRVIKDSISSYKALPHFWVCLQWGILISDWTTSWKWYPISSIDPWSQAHSCTFGIWVPWLSALLCENLCNFFTLLTSGPEWGSMGEKGKRLPEELLCLLGLSPGSPNRGGPK